MFFDPVYLLFAAPAILLAAWAQWRVHSAYSAAAGMPVATGYSGAEAARAILRTAGVGNVGVEITEGWLSDHYDPTAKVLRLSPDVYEGRTLAAVGIAAHEAGHAVQDAAGYAPLAVRNAIVPMASWGGNLSWIILMAGFLLASFKLVLAGIALFSLTVVFQLVNLPVEFDASRRAKAFLRDMGVVAPEEEPAVRRVLGAAAMTYVAATLSSVMTLLYYLYTAGLLGGDRGRDEA